MQPLADLRTAADAAHRRLISARNRRDAYAPGTALADAASGEVRVAHAEYRYALSLYRRATADAATETRS